MFWVISFNVHHCLLSDLPEELSKFSLIEHPSPLYCERKADLWQHINDTELEAADCDNGDCSTYQNQSNLLSVVNPGYLPVITHAGQLMIVPQESLPYRFSQDSVASSTLEPHNYNVIANDGATGGQSSWVYRKSAAMNAADETVLLTTNLAHNAGTHVAHSSSTDVSRRSSLNSRQHVTTTVTSETDDTSQTVSHFLF